MRFEQLSLILLSWGHYIKPIHYDQFKSYFEEMLRRKRVMLISNDSGPVAVITYFLTNNWEDYLLKSLWEVKDDNPEGSQIFIDKMVCKSWNLSMRRLLQEVIEENFNVLEGHYYHAPFGPHVTIKRRSKSHVQSANLIG